MFHMLARPAPPSGLGAGPAGFRTRRTDPVSHPYSGPVDSPRLNPLPPVEIAGVRFLVDRVRPVAVVRSSTSTRVVTWPDAPLPPTAAAPRLVAAPDAVWVVYQETESSGSAELAWSTTVRVGADGAVFNVDIGRLAVIGADAAGVWASPRPWLTPESLSGEENVDAPAPSFEDVDFPLERWEEFRKHRDRLHDERLARMEAEATRLARESETDSVVFGWWSGELESPETPPRRLSVPPAPGPSPSVELLRFRPDGSIDTLTVDRTVALVQQNGGQTFFTYYPTNPVGTLRDNGGWVSYSYPLHRIVADFGDSLPSTLAVGDFEATELSEDNWLDGSPEKTGDLAPADRVDLSGVTGVDWALAPLAAEEVDAAVNRIVEQLRSLAEPSTVWMRGDDCMHRVESPYHDLNVTVVGVWPHTTVDLRFRHREYSDAVYHRQYRVFDATGRPIDAPYLTVHIDEDIATRHHPEPRDGVIELGGE